MTEKRKSFLANVILGLMISVIVVYFRWDAEKSIIHQICDGTFVGGMMLLCIGGLKFARNGGTFDMMAYGIGSAVRITFPFMFKEERKDADFIAYKERKQEKRKPARAELLSGAIYMAISLICLAIYHL